MPEEKQVIDDAEFKVNVHVPITDEEKRRVGIIAAANRCSFRVQVAQFIREGIDKHMPAGKLVLK